MKFPSKKPRAALGLTATLAIAFFTLSAVVLLLSSGLQMVTTVQTQREAITNKQQLIAREASRAVSTFIQEKFSVLATTVELVDLIRAPAEEQKQILDSLLGFQPAFRQLVVLNAQSQEVAHGSTRALVIRIASASASAESSWSSGYVRAPIALHGTCALNRSNRVSARRKCPGSLPQQPRMSRCLRLID